MEVLGLDVQTGTVSGLVPQVINGYIGLAASEIPIRPAICTIDEGGLYFSLV